MTDSTFTEMKVSEAGVYTRHFYDHREGSLRREKI